MEDFHLRQFNDIVQLKELVGLNMAQANGTKKASLESGGDAVSPFSCECDHVDGSRPKENRYAT